LNLWNGFVFVLDFLNYNYQSSLKYIAEINNVSKFNLSIILFIVLFVCLAHHLLTYYTETNFSGSKSNFYFINSLNYGVISDKYLSNMLPASYIELSFYNY